MSHERAAPFIVRELVYHRMGKCQDKNEKSVDYPGQILQVLDDDGDFGERITLFVIFQEHFFLFSRLNHLFLHAAILRLKLNLNRITVENKCAVEYFHDKSESTYFISCCFL